MKKRISLLTILLFIAFGILLIGIFGPPGAGSTNLSDKVYWIVFTLWIVIFFTIKLKSDYSYKIAFGLFIVGALLSLVGYTKFPEIIMQMSFIGFVVALIQTLIERVIGNSYGTVKKP